MRFTRARLTLVAGLLLTAPLATACSDSDSDSGDSGGGGLEKSTIKVATLPVVDDAPLYLAIKHGIFKKYGLTVKPEVVGQPGQAVPGLAKGDIDVVYSNYVTFLQIHDKGSMKVKILAEAEVARPSSLACVAMPKSGVKTPKDLEGKTVGVPIVNSFLDLTTNAVLKANQADHTKVKYAQHPFPGILTALTKGQIASACFGEPWITNASKAGAIKVLDMSSGPTANWPVGGYHSNAAFVEKNPKTAAAFQKAMIEANGLAADRAKVKEVLPTYTQIDAATASIMTLPEYPTSVNITRLQRVADLMQSGGMTKTKIDINQIVFTPKA